jgi:hypothetical protein
MNNLAGAVIVTVTCLIWFAVIIFIAANFNEVFLMGISL